MAPIKSIQIRTKYAPWLSDQTKSIMKERDRAQKYAQQTNNYEDWRKYKNLRNTVNNKLKYEKVAYQRKKVIDCAENSSSIWKSIKSFLGWSSGGPPSQLINNAGELITAPIKLANLMNDYFINLSLIHI